MEDIVYHLVSYPNLKSFRYMIE